MKSALILAAVLVALPAGAQETPPSCTFGAGALPADTLPAGTPHGSQIPIDHIVVLMQENRSFDHYFGRLHYQGKRKSEGEPLDASNPNPLGGAPITAFHRSDASNFNARYCEPADLDHSWNGTHREWNGGAMDGFTAENVDPDDPSGSRAMGWYDRSDLNFYYILYKKFATADRYFCSVLSQTFPNRYFLLAATAFGHINNALPLAETDYAPATGTIFERLDAAGITWKVYYAQIAFAQVFAYVRNLHQANLAPVAQYFVDAQNGTLPQVSFVDPIFLGSTTVEKRRAPAGGRAGRAGLRVEHREGAFGEPALDAVRPLPHLRRARRLLRPRPAAARVSARRDPAGAQHDGRAGRLRPLRDPRPVRAGLCVLAASLRLAHRLRPRVDPAIHRDALRPARAHRAGCERRSDAGALRLPTRALPPAAAPPGPRRRRERAPAVHEPVTA
jgi:hypothetical protein